MQLGRALHRVMAAVLALWFGVLTAEPTSLHACPMHDLVAAGAPTGHGHAGHHAAPDSSAPTTHDCTCIGTCATAVAPAAPVASGISVSFTLVADAGIAAYARLASRIEFAIPFANGPPGA